MSLYITTLEVYIHIVNVGNIPCIQFLQLPVLIINLNAQLLQSILLNQGLLTHVH